MGIDFTQCLYRPDLNEETTFEEKLKCLEEGLFYCTGVAGGHDVPTGDFEAALEVVKKLGTLFEVIEHGEPDHRQWLKEAIEAHFTGNPLPNYVAK